jgi:hypothetical protein
MRRVIGFLPALVSVLMVSTSLSASACDLSCWLRQAPSDCHSGSSATEGNQRTMSATSSSSAMDMSSAAEMSSHAAQSDAGTDHIVNAGAYQSMPVHSMSAQMNMVGSSLQVIRKSELRSSAAFDHSNGRSNRLSLCSHETCSQVSASPPRASRAQVSYLACLAYLHCAAIPISTLANLSTGSRRITSETPPPINLAVDLLTTLRI